MITDDRHTWHTLDSIATTKAISFADLLQKSTLEVNGSTHLWLDLPLGGRWRATKTDAMRDRLDTLVGTSQQNIPVLMMLPYGNYRDA